MKRGTTHEKTDALLAKFREKVPDMAIRTTLIVGFLVKRKKNFKK
jgi:ribosomal protein S12 methylthiotransferase